MNRRTFLTTPLIPLIPKLAGAQGLGTTGPSAFDPWIEIQAANLRHNAGDVARFSKRPVLAVIKNNGYGLGVVSSAKVLEPHPSIYGFAVVKLQEALDLRDQGIKKPVLLMAPLDERDLQLAVSRDIMPMVYTPIGDLLER